MGSERITVVPKLADLTYAHTLVIKSTHEYKVHGPYGSNFPWTIWPTDLVFMSTFDNQSMSIGCVCKLGHLFGLLRHYLLNVLGNDHENGLTFTTITQKNFGVFGDPRTLSYTHVINKHNFSEEYRNYWHLDGKRFKKNRRFPLSGVSKAPKSSF